MLMQDYQKYKSKIMAMMKEIFSINFNINIDELNSIATEKTENLEKYLVDETAILFGCIYDDDLIAFAWLYVYDHSGEKRIHLNQIAVSSAYKGKGIGKKLMIEIEKEAIRIDAGAIDLYVMESNDSAKYLYESLDFKTEKRYMIKKMKENT